MIIYKIRAKRYNKNNLLRQKFKQKYGKYQNKIKSIHKFFDMIWQFQTSVVPLMIGVIAILKR